MKPILAAFVLMLAVPAMAADERLCTYWSREFVRVQIASMPAPDFNKWLGEISKEALAKALAINISDCIAKPKVPSLPDVVASTDQFWVDALWANLQRTRLLRDNADDPSMIGVPDPPDTQYTQVEPAADASGDEAWKAACAKRYGSFDPETGLVRVWRDPDRRKKGSVVTRCPL